MKAVLPFVSWGTWVAACGRDGCRNMEHYAGGRYKLGPPLHAGPPHVCGLTDGGFRCSECGWSGPVAWPDEADRIIDLLQQRPAPASQSWMLGEPVDNLLAENIEHGVSA